MVNVGTIYRWSHGSYGVDTNNTVLLLPTLQFALMLTEPTLATIYTGGSTWGSKLCMLKQGSCAHKNTAKHRKRLSNLRMFHLFNQPNTWKIDGWKTVGKNNYFPFLEWHGFQVLN